VPALAFGGGPKQKVQVQYCRLQEQVLKIKPMQDSNVGPYACLWGPYRSYVVCSTGAPITGFQEKKEDVVAYVMQRFKIQDSTTLFLELNQEIAGFRDGAAVQ